MGVSHTLTNASRTNLWGEGGGEGVYFMLSGLTGIVALETTVTYSGSKGETWKEVDTGTVAVKTVRRTFLLSEGMESAQTLTWMWVRL